VKAAKVAAPAPTRSVRISDRADSREQDHHFEDLTKAHDAVKRLEQERIDWSWVAERLSP